MVIERMNIQNPYHAITINSRNWIVLFFVHITSRMDAPLGVVHSDWFYPDGLCGVSVKGCVDSQCVLHLAFFARTAVRLSCSSDATILSSTIFPNDSSTKDREAIAMPNGHQHRLLHRRQLRQRGPYGLHDYRRRR